MIKCLVFTKERPLQLEAFLESLVFCSGIDVSRIHIIAPDDGHYGKLTGINPPDAFVGNRYWKVVE